ARLAALGIERVERARMRVAANVAPGWDQIAALDAATRMTAVLVDNGAARRGRDCAALIEELVDGSARDPSLILPEYRSAGRSQIADGDEEMLVGRGAVLVRARGRRSGCAAALPLPLEGEAARLPPELRAALCRPAPPPEHTLLAMLRADGIASPTTVG